MTWDRRNKAKINMPENSKSDLLGSEHSKNSSIKENIMFPTMLIISIGVLIYVGVYEVMKSKNLVALEQVCESGYCYYIPVNDLVSNDSNSLTHFEALTNKLDYLSSIGVELAIIDEFDIGSNDTNYRESVLRFLVGARRHGITVYMIITPNNYSFIRYYINFGVLGFVSKLNFSESVVSTNGGNTNKSLESVSTLLAETTLPINGLLFYLPTKSSSINKLIKNMETFEEFNYTILPISSQFITDDNKFIYRPEALKPKEYPKNINKRLYELVKILVQPKCFIPAGYEFSKISLADAFTSKEEIQDDILITALKDFKKFRSENIMFQKSLPRYFNQSNKKFTIYNRVYIQDNDQSSIAFFSIFAESNNEVFSLRSILGDQYSNQKFTVIYSYPSSNVTNLTPGNEIQFDSNVDLNRDRTFMCIIQTNMASNPTNT